MSIFTISYHLSYLPPPQRKERRDIVSDELIDIEKKKIGKHVVKDYL